MSPSYLVNNGDQILSRHAKVVHKAHVGRGIAQLDLDFSVRTQPMYMGGGVIVRPDHYPVSSDGKKRWHSNLSDGFMQFSFVFVFEWLPAAFVLMAVDARALEAREVRGGVMRASTLHETLSCAIRRTDDAVPFVPHP